ncbi:DUF3097 family protein [Arcanobacterium buesumense]|uniref:DUF3097 domain-containing protein n=1 Tax=Arcanobacterium buesumense TaxID=2722751 RepID=A0A6H2EL54_9ACTO|nr:DUF3097 family protein [Arcanobacterium buesumense]QJC21883.1 DUF3097 domain-containing protein [Arcanobacterium buesumense]
MNFDRYGSDVLASGMHRRKAARPLPVEVGMVLEDMTTGYVGEVVRVGKVTGQWQMELEDRRGHRRSFELGKGFWYEGVAVDLKPPVAKLVAGREDDVRTVAGKTLTASGSLHVAHKARVARPSRIWVEGKHDAELVAKIWGEDLAYEGIMIEELFGADHLLEVLDVFNPSDTVRAGVLLDHLVPGSKESRIAQAAMLKPGVLVLGHPYVDVWQAVKPHTVGIKAWPVVPREEDIKKGTLARLGWAHETSEDIGLGWKRILDSVRTYTDLEPALLGRMEELIDFVSAGQ